MAPMIVKAMKTACQKVMLTEIWRVCLLGEKMVLLMVVRMAASTAEMSL